MWQHLRHSMHNVQTSETIIRSYHSPLEYKFNTLNLTEPIFQNGENLERAL